MDEANYGSSAERVNRVATSASARIPALIAVMDALSGMPIDDARKAVREAGGSIEEFKAGRSSAMTADIDRSRVRVWVRDGRVEKAHRG